jgi:hypothetical protein
MNADSVPLIFFLVCCCIIVVPFSVLVIFLVLKGRKQAWTGTIIDKKANQSEDSDTGKKSMLYSVRIKTDDGKEFSLAVDEGRYSEYKDGDRLKKESGKLWPEKI